MSNKHVEPVIEIANMDVHESDVLLPGFAVINGSDYIESINDEEGEGDVTRIVDKI